MQYQLDIQGTRAPTEKALGGGLEGAERTNRATISWAPPIISPDRQINPVKDEADARGRDTVQNDGYAAGAIHTHRDSIVGAQYRLNAQPAYELLGTDEGWAEEFQQVVETEFNLMADSHECWFDASRKQNLTELVRLAVGGFLFTGEVLATVEWIRQVARPFYTAIQMVSPTRLCNPDGAPDDRFLRRGIKKDTFGEPLSYFFRMSMPGDFYMGEDIYRWKEVPARKPWGRRQVIHILDPLQPDQSRGIADMVAALKQLKMTRKFQEITLQNAVVNATYAAAIESELPKEMIFASMGAGQPGLASSLGEYMAALEAYVGGSGNIAIDGVKMPHLFPGTKLSLKPMGTPGGVGTDFEASLMRHTAAALGMSYEEFSRDFTQTNYSSARASMGQTFKFTQGRKKVVADKYATMVYHLWLEEKINAKAVPLPKGVTVETYYANPVHREALGCADWVGASRGQIDELKETQAAVMRMNAGLSNLEIEGAKIGNDYRRVLTQMAREQRLMKKLGIELMPDPKQPGANDAKNTMSTGDQ